MKDNAFLAKIRKELDENEGYRLSPLASLSRHAIRRIDEGEIVNGHRQNFSVDTDRILHSLAYSRYIDKTQVFYLIKNDHITHRVLHVQLVSKIARTVGRLLRLNEDLIELSPLGMTSGTHRSAMMAREYSPIFASNMASVNSFIIFRAFDFCRT